MNSYSGEIAALITAVSWTITALAFETAAKRIGSLSLNILRLIVALLMFSIIGLVVQGHVLPLDAGVYVWFWLSLSGLVGFVFGDIFLFQAYIDMGARLSQVVFVSSPLITAIMAYFILGEHIAPQGLLGMVLVVFAIIWVVLDKKPGPVEKAPLSANPPARRLRGALFAFLAALGQSGGLILSKIGAPDYNPFAATQIRVIAGLLGFMVLAACMKKIREPFRALKDLKALRSLSIGAFFGPFLGVSLGLYAIQKTSSGIAATLMGLTPILILIPAHFLRREKISFRETVGAVLAVTGSALIFFH